ncbi:S8 family serine peptidase [Clostridiaceae bacterium M8S5]|nr:S8 family serine peptidase [Clostridiaceae bacterium M8S5]
MDYLLNELINNEQVFYKMTDAKYKDYLWNLRLINIESLWDKITVKQLNNINIAIFDSGVDNKHADLSEVKAEGFNFVNNNYDIEDKLGHGTKINGIISGDRNGNGICGIASGAKIHNIKVINETGTGNIRNIIKAFQWAIENKMDIINMSIGHPLNIDSGLSKLVQEEREVINEAIKAGIIIVGAIGNIPGSDTQVPACYEGVISVGSYGVKNTKPIEFYVSKLNSNYCCDKTIFAPGEYVLTTTRGNSYGYDSGSSIAAAHVTGVIAYIKAMIPTITPDETHRILLDTCIEFEYETSKLNILNVRKVIESIVRR